MSSPTPLPVEIHRSAQQGELQKVVKWLRKGGLADALCSTTVDGRDTSCALLHTAASWGKLEIVKVLLRRGATVDLPSSRGDTALVHAAYYGHPSILLILLQHSANPDLQDIISQTALMKAADKGHEACVQALLRAKANTELLDKDGRTALHWAELKGHTAIAKLIRQHVVPPQPNAAAPAAPPEAAAVSSLTSLTDEVLKSAFRGELQKVIKWLREEGPVDAPCRLSTGDGETLTFTLLHAAATNDQQELVKVLLERGASVDLQTSKGVTALIDAAYRGHVSTLRVLLQHSANPDLLDFSGATALMGAAAEGQGACVQALLQAKANTELLDANGLTALQRAELKANTARLDQDSQAIAACRRQSQAIAALIRQHAAPPQPDEGSPSNALSRRTLPPSGHVGGEPATNMVVDAQLAEIEAHLLQAFRATPAESDRTIVKWVGKRVEPNAPNVQLARLVVRSLLEATCAETPSSTKLHAAIKDRAKVLRKFMQVGTESEQMAQMCSGLYEVQDYCARMDWPEKLMSKLFYQLYEADVVLEETFGVWRDDTTDESGHKRKGLVEVNEFLGWLETTDEDEEEVDVEEAAQAAQAARADAAMEKLLAEEAAEQAKARAPSKKSKKKKKKAGRATTASDEPSEASSAAALASPPAAAPKPAASAAERAEVALRAAIADGGLSALELALAAAPREVREGGVGAEARVRRDRLLEAQQEAEREAKQEAAAEAARLAAAERARGVAAGAAGRAAARAAAVSKAREEAVAAAAAAAAAAAKVDALERAMTDDGEGGSSGVAGPSEASEAAEVPDDYVCPITAEIMTDPVCTSDGFTYERTAISEWLRTKDTSPVTGATLESKTVIPNLSLRSMIRAFVDAQVAPPPPG